MVEWSITGNRENLIGTISIIGIIAPILGCLTMDGFSCIISLKKKLKIKNQDFQKPPEPK
jgi:hypothetical protein